MSAFLLVFVLWYDTNMFSLARRIPIFFLFSILVFGVGVFLSQEKSQPEENFPMQEEQEEMEEKQLPEWKLPPRDALWSFAQKGGVSWEDEGAALRFLNLSQFSPREIRSEHSEGSYRICFEDGFQSLDDVQAFFARAKASSCSAVLIDARSLEGKEALFQGLPEVKERAHELGLAFGVRGARTLPSILNGREFDFLFEDECFADGNCSVLAPIVEAGVPVYGYETQRDLNTPFCARAREMGLNWYFVPEDGYPRSCSYSEQEHKRVPEDGVRAMYLSQCGASSPKLRARAFDLLDHTELNAIVIDVKDSRGVIAFPNPFQQEGERGKSCFVSDMRDFVRELHKRGVYVIARIAVFQDPHYAHLHPDQTVQSKRTGKVWVDRRGLSFVDVGSRPYWEYVRDLSLITHQDYLFDEINYDYIRYPSDGNMWDTHYPQSDYANRVEELEHFFSFLHDGVKRVDPEGHLPLLSADLFGATTYHTDDLTIGQVLERALPYFDVIAPMVYPSHYSRNVFGYADPNAHPYGIVHESLKRALERIRAYSREHEQFEGEGVRILRPWLQDFDYGKTYRAEDVRAQIRAVEDLGIHSWMLWDPRNWYTRTALRKGEEE